MGVLLNSNGTVLYSHDLPVTSLLNFTEPENVNVLNYTDYLQYCNTEQRRTVDSFSLYLHFKATDQANVLERIENLHKKISSATAYKANTLTLLEELKNFSNPVQHTRMMVFLRALIFSSDATTQQTTANVIKAYCATQTAGLKTLQEHVRRHGSPPCIPGIDAITAVANTPRMGRLCAMENPKYFEHCLKNMFDMVIECNSRIQTQGLDTGAAENEYMTLSTEPGGNYAETNAKEEHAWKQLCRVHGNSTPKPDFHRIEFLLTLCEKYQGHNKTKRTLLKELHRRNITLTNVHFNVARPIIGTTANFEDEINAQMHAGPVAKAVAINAVGAGLTRTETKRTKMEHERGLVQMWKHATSVPSLDTMHVTDCCS